MLNSVVMSGAEKEEAKPPKGTLRKVALPIVIVVAIVIVLLVPMVPVQVSYTEVESYERLAEYEVVEATLTQHFDLIRGIYHRETVIVKNTDKYGGTFSVELRLYDVRGLFGRKVVSNYIAPGESKAFIAEFDTELGQDVRGEYEVSPPTVIDQRLVTKYKTVYKSILEILLYGRE